ncbi:F0F1 ATP synthase subunit A [Rhizohabitans arisaemae]|uniref:F0F1 ATP synthase subunit A n=1 Tax=Rhizohabitans arisaemae TaxID=2720610 RepID=UPI0024B1116C|nr:F0F1 ATP synthase subunit A [Rhizohabitans arisaemae]
MSTFAIVANDEFKAPGVEIFQLPPLWEGAPFWLTKPVVLAVVSALGICLLAWSAFAKPKLVPRGLQNVGEMGYTFVRDQVGRPFLGKDTDKWMGLLLSLFFLVWIWNLLAVVPGINFPVNSHIAFPAVLAIIIYLLKIYLGIRHQGFVGYFKGMMFPPGVPKFMYVLLAPIEFLQNMIFAPFTHAVRLFANMFAGHIILAFFSLVGFHFLITHLTPAGFTLGVLGVVMTILMTAFEMFIQFLQAFLFSLLAAMYIGQGLHAEH